MKQTRRLQRTRNWRPEITVAPDHLADLPPERGLWYTGQSDAAREQEQAHEADTARLLRWVRCAMKRRLTKHERRLVELYYLEAMTLEQLARRRRVHPTTVSRRLRRAVTKLRAAAAEEGVKRRR